MNSMRIARAPNDQEHAVMQGFAAELSSASGVGSVRWPATR
jgi:hypothetical protein